MKRISTFVMIAIVGLLTSCIGRSTEPEYFTAYKPVLMDRASLEKSIKWHSPAQIKSPGKIYYKDKFIMISERYKGVHIVDNTDPENPVMKGYISVPGCVDMAMKENTLYVDNAVDLVAIDVSKTNIGQIEVKKRVKATFPELVPPDNMVLPTRYRKENRPPNSVIVNWEKI